MGPFQFESLHIMETGGMKGRKKEMIRTELHDALQEGFGTKKIHSEYGMTELLSQAYSIDGSYFSCPDWMKVFIRETDDPFSYAKEGSVGGVNVIDLANWYSCPFIATDDLGRMHEDGSFGSQRRRHAVQRGQERASSLDYLQSERQLPAAHAADQF